MKQFIAALPRQAEIAIVLLGAFGVAVVRSLLIATGAVHVPLIDNEHLIHVIAYESVAFVLLGSFLWARGWTLERLGLGKFSFQDVIDGVGLVVVAYLVPACIFAVLPSELKHGIASPIAPTPLDMALVVATSIINPFFEEIFVVGYVFAALRGANGMLAMNVSIALRLAYHLYQGPVAVIAILPLAIVFAWWFATRPSLWCLILAHAALDLIGLSHYAA